MVVTFTRLKSGEWGLRSDEPLKSGQTVTVRKKDGSTKTMTIGKVVYAGGEVSLATIGEERAAPQYARTSTPSYSRPAYRSRGGRAGPRTPSPQPASVSYTSEQISGRLAAEDRTSLGAAQGFNRHDGAPELGEIIRRKDGSRMMVVAVDKAEYMSTAAAEEMEDVGHFGIKPGWHTEYRAIPVSASAGEQTSDRRAGDAATALQRVEAVARPENYRAAGISIPAGSPRVVLRESRSGGFPGDTAYLVGDEIVVTRYEYDFGMHYWVAPATPELRAAFATATTE